MLDGNIRRNFNLQLPGGDLTLAELQEMSTRQQQQMESQQQVLVAKEQRLKYLRQQEAVHAQKLAHSDQLRRATERVESQEMKLRKLRALRGQAEQYRHNNGQLTSELEAVRAVFNEKEKELAMAVTRVDQLTRQLQDLRSGHIQGNNKTAAFLELEKLRNELLIRNKLNKQQTQAIAAKEKLLSQRKEEVTRMDTRIHELQQRLKKRRSQEQQAAHRNASKKPAPASGSHYGGSNVATVEPYIQYAPQDVVKDDSYTKSGNIFQKQDPKYQTMPANVKFIPPGRTGEGQKHIEMNNNNQLIEGYQLPTVIPNNNNNISHTARITPSVVPGNNINDKGIDNAIYYRHGADLLVNANLNKAQKTAPPVPVKPLGTNSKQIRQPQQPQQLSQHLQQQHRTMLPPDKLSSDVVSSVPVSDSYSDMTKVVPTIGVTTPRAPGLPSSQTGRQSSSHPVISINEEERQAGSGQSSPAQSEGSDSSGGIHVNKENEGQTSQIGSVSAMIEKLNQKTGQSNNADLPIISMHPLLPSQTLKQTGLPTQSNAAVSHSTPGQNSIPQPGNEFMMPAHPTVSSQSGGQSHHLNHPQQNQPYQQQNQPYQHKNQPHAQQNQPHPLQNQSHQQHNQPHPQQHQPHLNQKPAPTYRYASKNQIANTYMGRLGGAAMEKYQHNLNQLYLNMDGRPGGERSAEDSESGGQTQTSPGTPPVTDSDGVSEGQGAQEHPQFGAVASPNYPDIASDKGSFKLNTPKHIRRRHSDSEHEDLNKALEERQELEHKRQQQPSDKQQENNAVPPPKSKNHPTHSLPTPTTVSPSSPVESQSLPEKSKSEQIFSKVKQENVVKKDLSEGNEKRDKQPSVSKAEAVMRSKKSNLKKEGVRRSTNRISFDPLALLLDASLEGELELVRKVAVQVDDVSTANDEGITALHNAICAGHYDIVKFLVEFGCDVNSPDSDGWTPLHCAASCNNLPMVRFLVEHGACVFATTISDQETAADKCEEEEDGYDGCSDYLYSIQEKLGITNNGEVFAVFDYQATNVDELSFVTGSSLTVLRKGDEKEKEWWWSRFGKEGYIPRNLLGLYPRVVGQAKVSEC